jgi:NAD(P)-dependent dehydrogenase (short-subunit alcohol dehydrogenase family)
MNANLFDLTGRIAVVTGAARELGRAAAAGLALHGADVAVTDLDRQRCSETIEEITSLGRLSLDLGENA